MTPLLTQVASSFIAPALAGAGAAAVAVPIAIHLLSRLRRKRQRWGAMRFLRLAYQKQKNRLRLEQWLLLATRCLLVLLIGLALAGPVVGGVVARWLSGAGGGGRTVHVVIDDALTSGVVGNQERGVGAAALPRLDDLKRDAAAILDALGPGDRAVLWRTTAPDQPAEALSGGDGTSGGLRAELDALRPGYGTADWAGTLSAVTRRVEDDGGEGGRPVVAVLSGFARGAGRLAEAPPRDAALGDLAAVGLSRPAGSRPNQQIASVTPRRAVVLTPAPGRSVEVAVVLRRFEDTAEPGTATVRVELWTAGEPREDVDNGLGAAAPSRAGGALELASSVQRPVVWSVGQDTLTQTLAVPLPAIPEGRAAQSYAVRALVVSAAGRDALPGDDAAWTVVEAVRQLRVGIQGGAPGSISSAPGSPSGAAFTTPNTTLGPASFVRAALGGGGGAADAGLDAVELARLDAEALEPLDAVFVLSPGRLGPAGWAALRAWVEGGGVAWITPDAADRGSLTWPAQFARAFPGAGSPAAEARASDTPVALDDDAGGAGAPPALAMLSGSWPALLGPVRVSAWVPVVASDPTGAGGDGTGSADDDATTAESSSSSNAFRNAGAATTSSNPAGDRASRLTDAVWLRVGPDGTPWLTAHRRGLGTVLLLGSALHPDWTNLTAKPLFPALVQDALRSSVAQRLGQRAWRVGDAPPPDVKNLAAAQRLRLPVSADASAGADDNVDVGASNHVDLPGVFRVAPAAASPGPSASGDVTTGAGEVPSTSASGSLSRVTSGGSGGLYVLNPDAAAGDSAALDDATLGAWWDAAGPWSFLPEDPGELLAQESPRAALGWLLLWAVLALLLLEAALSRAFSHAATDKPRLSRRAMSLAHRWRHGEFAERAGRKAA